MHFHLPRRFRRPLLFPSGLLALAGLLWLGCVAVQSWQEKLKTRHAIRLTMLLRPTHHNSKFIRLPEVPNPDTVCKSCNWQDAFFTGNPITDMREQAKITQYVCRIATDTTHAGGVRIRFTSNARYASLVFSLNLMNEYGIKKYWLDITRSPTTFYVITDAYKPRIKLITTNTEIIPTLFVNDVIYSQAQPSEEQVMSSQTARWQLKWLQPLQRPEWRVLLWLLAVMAVLSTWRIIQAWHKV